MNYSSILDGIQIFAVLSALVERRKGKNGCHFTDNTLSWCSNVLTTSSSVFITWTFLSKLAEHKNFPSELKLRSFAAFVCGFASLISFCVFKSQYEIDPHSCATAALITFISKNSGFISILFGSPYFERSIENSGSLFLKSHNLSVLSLPTLVNSEPSWLGLIQKVPPSWPDSMLLFSPLSASQTIISLSPFPPESNQFSRRGWNHTVLTFAAWPVSESSNILDESDSCIRGFTSSLICLSFEPVAMSLSFSDQSMQYIEPSWWLSWSKTIGISWLSLTLIRSPVSFSGFKLSKISLRFQIFSHFEFVPKAKKVPSASNQPALIGNVSTTYPFSFSVLML